MTWSELEESIGPPRGGIPKKRIEEPPEDYPDPPPPQQQSQYQRDGDAQYVPEAWDDELVNQPEVWDGGQQQEDAWDDIPQDQEPWDNPPLRQEAWVDSTHIDEPKSRGDAPGIEQSWVGSPMKGQQVNGSAKEKPKKEKLKKKESRDKSPYKTLQWQGSPHQQQPQNDTPHQQQPWNGTAHHHQKQQSWDDTPQKPQPQDDSPNRPQKWDNAPQELPPWKDPPLKPPSLKGSSQKPKPRDDSSHKPQSLKGSTHQLPWKNSPQKSPSWKDSPSRPEPWKDSPQKPKHREDTPQQQQPLNDIRQKPKRRDKSSHKPRSSKDLTDQPQLRGDSPRRKRIETPPPHPPAMPPQPPAVPQGPPIPEDPSRNDPKPNKNRKLKSSHPPRPPPIPQQLPPSADSLLTLLRSKQFSDVTVAVGTGKEKRIYELHKNILCTKSDYFAGSVYHLDSDPRLESALISLRDLSPPIFDLVLEWIYGDVLVLELNQPLISALYRAATFLSIHGLKIHIARSVSKMLKYKRKKGTPIHFDGFEIVRGLFEYAESPEYFTSLRKCTDELALQFNLPMHMINAEMSKNDDGATKANTKFWMALAMSYQKALHATVCSECRSIVSTRTGTGLDRMCCHCDTDDKDMEVPRPPPPPPAEMPRQGSDYKSKESDYNGKGRADGKVKET
ncbi:uncharacterized protein DFL_000383 [Arthrobotrys flagrans]|uniref:BTB domain-containing protein n=1 Tax=Arthrobotrys flagrans TaxID=97331 RepID=A0A437AE53_ARTFL|nr:hypothetical protein DFL_000383 [Arthrobotrys flagrans]